MFGSECDSNVGRVGRLGVPAGRLSGKDTPPDKAGLGSCVSVCKRVKLLLC